MLPNILTIDVVVKKINRTLLTFKLSPTIFDLIWQIYGHIYFKKKHFLGSV